MKCRDINISSHLDAINISLHTREREEKSDEERVTNIIIIIIAFKARVESRFNIQARKKFNFAIHFLLWLELPNSRFFLSSFLDKIQRRNRWNLINYLAAGFFSLGHLRIKNSMKHIHFIGIRCDLFCLFKSKRVTTPKETNQVFPLNCWCCRVLLRSISHFRFGSMELTLLQCRLRSSTINWWKLHLFIFSISSNRLFMLRVNRWQCKAIAFHANPNRTIG